MDTLLQDIRYGIRMLVRKPGFTVVAILVLALGIGANSAIFSVVDAVLLRSLPYDNPDALVMLWGQNVKENVETDPISYPNFRDWKAQNTSFENIAVVTPQWTFNLTGASEPERISGMFTSVNLFPMLGVTPARGRLFLPEEEQPGGGQVVILSHGLWQRSFGGEADIIGKAVTIDGEAFTVVGLMPAGFEFLDNVDLWTPLAPDHPAMTRFIENRAIRLYRVVGRLKPGVTLTRAQAEMTGIAGRLEQQYPDTNTGMGIRLVPLQEQITGSFRSSLFILFGAVGFVLLIACANVANLILTRSADRQKEVAVRIALGAGRLRIIRQLLTESVLLAFFSGLVGLLIAFWGVDALLALSPATMPRQETVGVDGPVLGFTFLISLMTGILFGLAPALQASRQDQHNALKEGGRSSRAGSTRFRNALVVSEIALALVLLICSGLLIRSFMRVLDQDPGFRTDHLLTMTALLPQSVYGDPPKRIIFCNELEERLGALPGVTSVGAVTRLPLRGGDNNITATLTIEGRNVPEGEKPEIDFRRASPDYFRTMGIPLLQGRGLTERDISEEQTALINEALARRFFPDEDPVGKRIRLGANSDNQPWITIVGVVGNVRHTGLEIEPRPEVYRHLMTFPPSGPIWAIRTAIDPLALIPSIRSLMRSMDPDLPVSNIATMDELIARSVAQRRFAMQLLGLFAGVALLLAAIGIYGVMSYAVTQQTHEIGIRMALGAQPGDILRLVVGHGMLLTVIGVGLGVVAAFGLTGLLSSLLYGITPTDPITFAAITVFLTVIALIANYLPARRAMRVDPMVALRYE